MRNIILLLILVIIVSCNVSNSRKSKVSKYIDYYSNGNVKVEGNILYDSIKIGKWTMYDSLGNCTHILNYKNINNSTKLNTYWILNKNKDTIRGMGY